MIVALAGLYIVEGHAVTTGRADEIIVAVLVSGAGISACGVPTEAVSLTVIVDNTDAGTVGRVVLAILCGDILARGAANREEKEEHHQGSQTVDGRAPSGGDRGGRGLCDGQLWHDGGLPEDEAVSETSGKS